MEEIGYIDVPDLKNIHTSWLSYNVTVSFFLWIKSFAFIIIFLPPSVLVYILLLKVMHIVISFIFFI